jgi:hypothetical protein
VLEAVFVLLEFPSPSRRIFIGSHSLPPLLIAVSVLHALNIDFKPRTTIKSQALVDFMAEWLENQLPTPTERPEHWVMYFDGLLMLEGAGAGVLLISPKGEQLKYILQIFWNVSNNEVEYEALLHGLRLAISLGIK